MPNGNTDVGITASSIKVGHIGIYSGPVGYVGQNLSLAARATLQSINDAGGINGRKLDVLVRDDGWDGTKGINAARDLVEREKVFAICCTQSVSTTDPLTPYADQQKVPNVGPDGWGQVQYTGQWTYPVGVPAASEARVLANESKNLTERLETRKLVERAKGVLRDRHGLSEEDSFRLIQRISMERGMPMRKVSERLLDGDVWNGRWLT